MTPSHRSGRSRRVVAALGRRLPAPILQRTVAGTSVPRPVRRAAGLGLADRWTTISSGPAAGLAFNCGPSNASYTTGTNEVPVQQVFVDHVGPGDVVLDIGANVGFFTVLAARLTEPSGQVVAFEPDDVNASAVEANIARNRFDHARVVRAAVAASAGRARLWLADYAGGHALESAGRPPDAVGETEVEVVTIDDLRTAGQLPAPTFVKIDVEGAELDALHGMERTLREDRPTVLVEADAPEPAELEARLGPIVALLEQCRYETTRVDDAYGDIGWCVAHVVATPR